MKNSAPRGMACAKSCCRRGTSPSTKDLASNCLDCDIRRRPPQGRLVYLLARRPCVVFRWTTTSRRHQKEFDAAPQILSPSACRVSRWRSGSYCRGILSSESWLPGNVFPTAKSIQKNHIFLRFHKFSLSCFFMLWVYAGSH